MRTLTITRPDDWHLHLRDGGHLRAVLPDTARRFGRAIVMPNLKPPVTTTRLALEYRGRVLAALPAGAKFEPLMTLYLTEETDPDDVAAAAAEGLVTAVKLYPAGATTNSASGVHSIRKVMPVLERMVAGLAKGDNPYRGLLAATSVVLEHDLDASWPGLPRGAAAGVATARRGFARLPGDELPMLDELAWRGGVR